MPSPETKYRIPFNKPCFEGNELKYVSNAMSQGHTSGDGPYTRRCHELLEQVVNGARVLLTTSCTHALEMAALLLDLKPGDEVIVPSFTFVSSVNAFVLRGAKPVFIDIRPDTLNLNETQLEGLITPNTRAILAVHYAGVACDMECINSIAARRHLAVVEDNAHGLFGSYKSQPLGTLGCLASQSFHETKNVTCGEGGALVINDRSFLERAEVIREKGTNRSRFFRGQVDKYTWEDLGSSYLPSEILAAVLCAQLERRAEIQSAREKIWNTYRSGLAAWASRHDVQLPFVPEHCNQPYHMFYLIMPSLEARQSLIAFLKSRGILSVFHYLPLHLSKMGLGFGGREGQCPITERVSDCLLRLPFYAGLTPAEQAEVIDAVCSFDGHATR